MTDKQVLEMPSYRFWALESQIVRIMSERDMRTMNVNAATMDQESRNTLTNRLTLELGEAYKVEHSQIVKPEPDVGRKFKNVMRG